MPSKVGVKADVRTAFDTFDTCKSRLYGAFDSQTVELEFFWNLPAFASACDDLRSLWSNSSLATKPRQLQANVNQLSSWKTSHIFEKIVTTLTKEVTGTVNFKTGSIEKKTPLITSSTNNESSSLYSSLFEFDLKRMKKKTGMKTKKKR